MKKLLYLSAIAVAALSSCKAIDPIEEKAEYTNSVVYSVDTLTNIGVATDYAKINVSADNASMLFQLTFSDLKLQPDANLETVKISGLTQYLKDVINPIDGQVNYLYTFFSTPAANTDGISIRNLRFGWLSTVYWCGFTSGPHRVWMLPKKIRTYAVKNLIINERGDSIHENAIYPCYNFELNVSNNTVSIYAAGVKFPKSDSGAGKHEIEFRNEYNLEDIKVNYNHKGFTASAAVLNPVTDGARNRYKITDFYLNFEADYDGEREARYTLTEVSTGESFKIVSTFSYNNDRTY